MMEGSCILKRTIEKSPPKWNCTEHQIRLAFIQAASRVCNIVDNLQEEAKRAIIANTLKLCYNEQYLWEHNFTDWLLDLQRKLIYNLNKPFSEIKEPMWIYPPKELNFSLITDILMQLFESINYDCDVTYAHSDKKYCIRPRATYFDVVKVEKVFL